MEKSRSWPSAHDWKSCIPQKGIEGSNPSFSAIKQIPIHTDGDLFYIVEVGGFERPLRKHAGGMFLGRGKIPRNSGVVQRTMNELRLMITESFRDNENKFLLLSPNSYPTKFFKISINIS